MKFAPCLRHDLRQVSAISCASIATFLRHNLRHRRYMGLCEDNEA